MKDTSNKELGDLGTGYRVLDVRCSSIDDEVTSNDGCEIPVPPRRALPGIVSAAPSAASSCSFDANRLVAHRPTVSIRYSMPTVKQIVSARRQRKPSWFVKMLLAERVPLMLALAGIATSAFLAMLFSIVEPRTAVLSRYEGANVPAHRDGDILHYDRDAQTRVSEGDQDERVIVPIQAPGGTAPQIFNLRSLIIFAPMLIGVGIFLLSMVLRLMGMRRNEKRESDSIAPLAVAKVGVEPTVSENPPVVNALPGKIELLPLESPRQPPMPQESAESAEQKPMRRAA
jgi:hypothetical protein